MGNTLLLEVVEAREQVLGESPLRVRVGLRMRREELPQRLACHALHDEGEAPLHHLAQVDDANDVRVIQRREDLVLVAQRLFGGVVDARDLERAGPAADEVAGGVDDRHAALAEPRDDLVVRTEANARVQVVRIQRRASVPHGGKQIAWRGVPAFSHRPNGFRQIRVAVGGPQLDHAGHGLVEGQRDALGHVSHAHEKAALGHELTRALEERLARQQECEDGAQAELVGGRLRAAEGRDHLGGCEHQPLVSNRRERHGGVDRELLRKVEPSHADRGRLGAVLDQDDLGTKEPVHHALAMGLVERGGETDPEVSSRHQVGLLAALRPGTVLVDPGGEGDAAEVFERQDDARLVGERRVRAEDPLAATEAPQDLGLPARALGDAVALRVGCEWRDAVDPQDALGVRKAVLAEQLGERLVVCQRVDDLVLAHATNWARSLLDAGQQPKKVVLGGRGTCRRETPAEALDKRGVLNGGEDVLPRVDAIVRTRAADSTVGGRGKEHEALNPGLARLVAFALELALQDLCADPVLLDRTGHRVGDVPIVVRPLDATAVGLDLDDVDGMRRDDDGVELVDDTRALDEPRIAVDRVLRRQALYDVAKRLTLGVMGGLADWDELGHHGLHQQYLCAAEPDRELVLDAEEAALVRVKANDEVEAALPQGVVRVA